MLVIDSHPLVPTAVPVQAALERLADRLARSGVRVERSHSQLPDLAEATRLYMRLLVSFSTAFMPQARYDEIKNAGGAFAPDDLSLTAERARAIGLSHRDWVLADVARNRLQQQWRALFAEVDVVLCPPMPVTAFAHDHSAPVHERRRSVDGKPYPYVDVGLVWAGPATCAGLPAAVVPIDRGDSRDADRRAGHRPVPRGPHRAGIRGRGRARVRRFRAAAGVRSVVGFPVRWVRPHTARSGMARGRGLTRMAPEEVSSNGLKPCSVPQSHYRAPNYGCLLAAACLRVIAPGRKVRPHNQVRCREAADAHRRLVASTPIWRPSLTSVTRFCAT